MSRRAASSSRPLIRGGTGAIDGIGKSVARESIGEAIGVQAVVLAIDLAGSQESELRQYVLGGEVRGVGGGDDFAKAALLEGPAHSGRRGLGRVAVAPGL